MKKLPKGEEIIAEKYLKSLEFKKIEFEPDGNKMPDFLCDSKIAVEVRRLNKNYKKGKKTEGLDVVEKKLIDSVKNIISEIGSPLKNESWGIDLDFSPPLEHLSKLRSKIKSALIEFSKREERKEGVIFEGENIKVKVVRSKEVLEKSFDLFCGPCRTGWLAQDWSDNLEYCIEEKTEKLKKAPTFNKYKTWWLVLVDNDFPLMSNVEKFVKEFERDDGVWEKIIIINPESCSKMFEL